MRVCTGGTHYLAGTSVTTRKLYTCHPIYKVLRAIPSDPSNPQQLTRAARDARESFGACNLPLEAFFVREEVVQIVVSYSYTSIEDPGGW